MALSPHFDLKKNEQGEPYLETSLTGMTLLRSGLLNKGTAFNEEERRELGLEGLLPPRINTMEQQIDRAYTIFSEEPTPIAKYLFLRNLQERNETLYFALLQTYITEMMPVVYTPTVGQAVQEFSLRYQSPRGLTFDASNIDHADRIVANVPQDDVRMIVVTDSAAILGIGDQGWGGIGISIGKLALYTAGGGVNPAQSLPVGLDVGCNRDTLRNSDFYLGVDEDRMTGDKYYAFVDKFIKAAKKRWPNVVIQWEDFSKNEAYGLMYKYRDELPSFNDDVQGTGAVALAGVLTACAQKGEALKDQQVVISGAGAGGVGVAWAMVEGMKREGLNDEEAHARVMVLDSRGLLTEAREMEDYKKPFGQKISTIADWDYAGDPPSMMETLKNSKATVLLGLSGQSGQFTHEIVKAVAANAERPIIFPLSNPTKNCEAIPADVLEWTNGKAIVATGSPFAPVELGGETYHIGQGNNAFVFPGLGVATIISGASKITDGMIMAASYALAEYTAAHHSASGLIYPPIAELQQVSLFVTRKVIEQAMADGVATNPELDTADLDAYIQANLWKAEYVPVKPA